MDGFFVAKLQKIANTLPKSINPDGNEEENEEASDVYQVDEIEKESAQLNGKTEASPGTKTSKEKRLKKIRAKKIAKKKAKLSNGESESSTKVKVPKGNKNKNKANGNASNVKPTKGLKGEKNGSASKVANGVESKGKKRNSVSASETKSPKKKARKNL